MWLTARGKSLAAFDERCIPTPPQRGCRVGGPGASGVAPPSNTPGIAPHRAHHARRGPRFSVGRALPAGRLARLGATPDFHHGLLDGFTRSVVVLAVLSGAALDPRPQGGGLSLCRAGTRGWLRHGRTSSRARVGT